MPRHRTNPPVFFSGILAAAIILIVTLLLINCNNKKPPPIFPNVVDSARIGLDTIQRTVSWNVLFNDGTTGPERNLELYLIEQHLTNWIRTINPAYYFEFDIFYCPCDTLLYNLAANALDGSGNSVTVPPPPPPPPGGSGDRLYVSNNNAMEESDSIYVGAESKRTIISSTLTPDDRVLAIIDTGIDTTRFTSQIRQLIWQPAPGKQALFNYVVGGIPDRFFDDHKEKHGTVVTALALHAMSESPTRPRLMILKALDYKKRGSTFTVSCALSYALQNHATVINASLGYYERNGKVDSVFRYYINRCNTASPQPIPIFAAAGNKPGFHPLTNLCTPAPDSMQLTEARLFYPASFSTTMENVISVTSLNNAQSTPCSFQNYSPSQVSIGVVNDNNCCAFFVPSFRTSFEGSSFATPVACGIIMGCMVPNGGGGAVSECLASAGSTDPRWITVVKNGRFLNYHDTSIW